MYRILMTISKPYLTLLASLTFILIGVVINYITDSLFFIPMLFGLGIPLVNVDKPIKKKIVSVILISLLTTLIFSAFIWTSLNLFQEIETFHTILPGLAGIIVLVVNRLFIATIRLNSKTLITTFLLSWISIVIWKLFINSVSPIEFSIDSIAYSIMGALIFWTIFTTIGICSAIQSKAINSPI